MITVKNRKMIIPTDERIVGTVADNNSEERYFSIPRFAPNGVDMSALTYGLDMEYENTTTRNATYLTKEVSDTDITLCWGLVNDDVAPGGTMFVQITAVDYEGTVKWVSEKAAFYISPVIGTAAEYTGSLSALERIEVVLDQKLEQLGGFDEEIDEIEAAEAARVAAETARASAETSRVSAEADRVSAETIRVSNESTRSTNEATRQSNETTRISNENTRIANESARASAISDAQAATASANTAASAATVATTNADAATLAANTAATNAQKVADDTEALRKDIQKLIDEGGVVTPTEKANWNAAYTDKHTHVNKTVLDNVTQTIIDNAHTHTNKSVIDGIGSSDITSWNGKAEKSVVVNATLDHLNWMGSQPPYTNTITVSAATLDNNIELVIPDNATKDQVEAYTNATIVNGSQGVGTITLKAWGSMPSIDLPIKLLVRGD